VSYVKPHGALYNTVVTNAGQACAGAAAVQAGDAAPPVLGLHESAMFDAARELGLRCVAGRSQTGHIGPPDNCCHLANRVR
jgi:UPF0271 protein